MQPIRRSAARHVATACLVAAAVPGARASSAVTQWNAAALQEVRLSKFGPPVVARALAVAHTCMYDAWAAYDTKALPTASTTPRRPAPEATDANKQKAVSYAAYGCLVNLFPAGAARLRATMTAMGHDPADLSLNLATPQGVGNAAAQAVIAARRNDGSNQYGDLAAGAYADYTGYTPVNAPAPYCNPLATATCTPNAADPLRWQPLISDSGATQKFVAPHWYQVRPFALTSASQFDALPEVAAGPNFRQSAARYQADVDNIVQVSGQLNAAQKLVVELWADGPASELPPGHWGLIAQHVSARDGYNVDKDVKLFFAMHNASFDAGIVAWYLKRKWDGVRPITAVRTNKQGQTIFAWGGPGRPNGNIDGAKWSPYNPGSNLTPAFPGWVSGHSTFSAASASILRSFTGSDVLNYAVTLPANYGRVEPGIPAVPTTLTYATYTDAVADAGMSRLYAGIHFADDNAVGHTLGNLVAQRAWEKAQTLFSGGVAPAAAPTVAATPVAGATWCASENEHCAVPAGSTATVWYGAGARWVARSGLTGLAYCRNDAFGDPVRGTVKSCYLKIEGPTAAQRPPAGAVDCSTEGGNCTLPRGAVATVWYGAGGNWVRHAGMVGVVSCQNQVFSGDPAPGIVKRCAYTVEQTTYTLPPPEGAVPCASDGTTCTLPAGRKATVWYGAGRQWTRLPNQQTAVYCCNTVFGDPSTGTPKSCSYVLE